MSSASFLAKLLVGPTFDKPSSYGDFSRSMMWEYEDLANEVLSGRWNIDPTERVACSADSKDFPLAFAYMRRLPRFMKGYAVIGNIGIPEVCDDFSCYLIENGNLKETDKPILLKLALETGAFKTFTQLTKDWSHGEIQSFAEGFWKPLGEKTETSSPIIHYAIRAGLHKFVEFFLDAGVDPNIKNKKGETLLHWASLPDLFPKLKSLGIDGSATNDKGQNCITFWNGLTLTAARKKDLGNQFKSIFSGDIDPAVAKEQAIAILLNGISSKTKTLLVSQMSHAGIKADSIVNNKNIIENIVADSLINGSGLVAAPLRLLLPKAPEPSSGYSNSWLIQIASIGYHSGLEDFFIDKHENLRGEDRLNAVFGAVDSIVPQANRADVWRRVETFALLGRPSNKYDELETNQYDRPVLESAWFRYLSKLNDQGVPKIVEIHQDRISDKPAELLKRYFNLKKKFSSATPLPGNMEDWMDVLFNSLKVNAVAPNQVIEAPGFEGKLLASDSAAQFLAGHFLMLWSEGYRPPAEKAQEYLEYVQEHQRHALPAFLNWSMECTTASVSSNNKKALRL